MTPKIFSAADFTNRPLNSPHIIAQDIFENWLKEQPVVTGWQDDDSWVWGTSVNKPDTHTARLVAIEEIKREPCKHEADGLISGTVVEYSLNNIKCRHCGVKLVAEWKAAE